MKRIRVPFGTTHFSITVPDTTEVLSLNASRPVRNLNATVEASLEAPIGSPPLQSIIQTTGRADRLRVAIALSDVTRSTPYAGTTGILSSLLHFLETCGIKPSNEAVTLFHSLRFY